MKFEIIPNRQKWFLFSGVLVGLSIMMIGTFGINLGIDFTGGTELTVKFSESLPQREVLRTTFQETLGNERGEEIVRLQDNSGYQIRSMTLSEEDATKLQNAMNQHEWGANIEKVNTIGPTMGSEFKKNAFWAILLSIVAIILFIAFSFRRVPEGLSSWKFGLAATVALAHDITIIVGLFALLGTFLGVEIDTLFITALLTVLGFSVNDTIVIFDRIRENLKGQKNAKHFGTICEQALWQSMRRSINTSLSTLIVLLSMLYFFLGYPDLFSFFLALSLGFVIGTYSSIFLAAPLLVTWQKK